MSKFFNACILVVMLFIGISFADVVPLVDGKYHFVTNNQEHMFLEVEDKTLKMYSVVEDGYYVINFELRVDDNGVYFYYSQNGNDSTDYVVLFFDSKCLGIGEMSKYGYKFALYNVECTKEE